MSFNSSDKITTIIWKLFWHTLCLHFVSELSVSEMYKKLTAPCVYCFLFFRSELPIIKTVLLFFLPLFPRGGELRTQKLNSHLVRTQSLNVLPWKPEVGQYIAMHATLTARDFFLAYFYPSGPFTCIFFQNLSRFLLCRLWLIHGSCVGPPNKIGHLAGCRFPCWVPAECK